MKEVNKSIVIEKNIEIPMRDNVKLSGDLYLPKGTGDRKFPCLIQRTPYDKNEIYKKSFPPELAATYGFAVLVQDTRGRFKSQGDFRPFDDDANDGYDTVEWAAKQPWCNGKIGMYGGSYAGVTQLLAATKKPPHLVAMLPAITGSINYNSWSYNAGAFKLINLLGWTLVMLQHTAKRHNIMFSDSILEVLKGLDELHHISFSSKSNPQEVFEKTEEVEQKMHQLLMILPLFELPVPKEKGAGRYFFERLGDYKNIEHQRMPNVSQIRIPMIHIGGWYDMFDRPTVENFLSFSESNAYQRLVMGPWSHGSYKRKIGELDFGPESEWTTKVNDLHRCWFEYWLMDKGDLGDDKVQIFVMGENRWRSEKEFPLKRTKYEKWYFHSNGNANTLAGDGVLSLEPPGSEPVDRFVYDPRNPVPSKGGNILPLGMNPGPRDQRSVEKRHDVLVYTSNPLEKETEVTGPLRVRLWASTDVVETDFTAKLVDVHPNGYAQNIQSGIICTSFRESNSKPSLIKPYEVYEYEIHLNYTSNLFKKGHRLRVEITSSNFPHYARNLNSGEEHHLTENVNVANQTIYHSKTYPSHIILPVIPR